MKLSNDATIIGSLSCNSLTTTNDITTSNLYINDNGIISIGDTNNNNNINKIKLNSSGTIGFGYVSNNIVYTTNTSHQFYYDENSLGMKLERSNLAINGELDVTSNTMLRGIIFMVIYSR